jgi:hypothetical protein
MADTIRTEADLKNNLFPDNQAAGSITAQDMRDLITSVRYLQPLGWQFRFDSQYTEGSPLTLTADTPTKITFTDNPGEDLRYPSTFPELWDNANQKLDISNFANGFGIIRLSFRGSYTGGTVPHIDLWIDAGSDPVAPAGGGTASNIIYEGSEVFAKGAGTTQSFNYIVPLFGGADFVANGGQFIVQSHDANSTIWQVALTMGAILVPNPAGEG